MLDNSFDSTAATDDANTAVLVNLNIGNNKRSEDLEELRQLAVSAKLTILPRSRANTISLILLPMQARGK